MPHSARVQHFGTRLTYTATAKSSLDDGCHPSILWFSLSRLLKNFFFLIVRFKRTGKRDQIFLSTKFGMSSGGFNGTPEYVRSSIEKSLKRLGVETIDLYYLHVMLLKAGDD